MARAHVALFALAALLGGAECVRVGETATFEEYVGAFGRGYGPLSSEYELRRGLFERRAEAVRAHNAQPGRRWTAGLNALTDWTEVELMQLRGWRSTRRASGSAGGERFHLLQEKAIRSGPPAKKVDWTSLAAANQIMDQGSCGSCWAVASSLMLQAHYEIHMKGNRTFATQELVNCVANPDHCGGDGGCQGATVELAMDYVEKHGLRENHELPYEGQDGECPSTGKIAGLAVVDRHNGAAALGFQGWTKLPENKAHPLMQALMDGPVGISAGADTWMNYESGVFDGCSKDVIIDHAVLLLGYGGDQSSKWWTVQNSWGPQWGEKGHIRLLRQDTAELEDKNCGVDHDPKLGTACKPFPESVPVCGMCGMLYDSVAPHFVAKGAALVSLRGGHRARGNRARTRTDF